ncbi:MAG: hypothetical protein PHG69_06775, partial [Candidatus Omnitrophica bacterium]|nr:hypothetical protein [Candidatus Omnitrophota bacterium]
QWMQKETAILIESLKEGGSFSPEAQNLLDNPETAVWGKTFTPRIYFEIEKRSCPNVPKASAEIDPVAHRRYATFVLLQKIIKAAIWHALNIESGSAEEGFLKEIYVFAGEGIDAQWSNKEHMEGLWPEWLKENERMRVYTELLQFMYALDADVCAFRHRIFDWHEPLYGSLGDGSEFYHPVLYMHYSKVCSDYLEEIARQGMRRKSFLSWLGKAYHLLAQENVSPSNLREARDDYVIALNMDFSEYNIFGEMEKKALARELNLENIDPWRLQRVAGELNALETQGFSGAVIVKNALGFKSNISGLPSSLDNGGEVENVSGLAEKVIPIARIKDFNLKWLLDSIRCSGPRSITWYCKVIEGCLGNSIELRSFVRAAVDDFFAQHAEEPWSQMTLRFDVDADYANLYPVAYYSPLAQNRSRLFILHLSFLGLESFDSFSTAIEIMQNCSIPALFINHERLAYIYSPSGSIRFRFQEDGKWLTTKAPALIPLLAVGGISPTVIVSGLVGGLLVYLLYRILAAQRAQAPPGKINENYDLAGRLKRNSKLVFVQTEQANYVLGAGVHIFRTKVPEDILESVDAFILEGIMQISPDGKENRATFTGEKARLSWKKAMVQYGNLMQHAFNHKKSIFYVDTGDAGWIRKLGKFNFTVGVALVVASLVIYPIIGACILFTLLSVNHPLLAYFSLLLCWPLVGSSLAILLPRSLSLINKLLSRFILVGGFWESALGYRSAWVAHKAETCIAPELFRRLGRKPTIWIEYGRAHFDILGYLSCPKIRKGVLWWHRFLPYALLAFDKRYESVAIELDLTKFERTVHNISPDYWSILRKDHIVFDFRNLFPTQPSEPPPSLDNGGEV